MPAGIWYLPRWPPRCHFD